MRRLLIAALLALLCASPSLAQFSSSPGSRPRPGDARTHGGTTRTVLLKQYTVSASTAELDFPLYPDLYDEYVIDVVGLLPTASAGTTCLQFTKDGGATYQATNYSYAQLIYGASTNFGQYLQSASTSCMLFSAGVHSNAAWGVNAVVTLFLPAGQVPMLLSEHAQLAADSNSYGGFERAFWSDTSVVNGFRLIFSGANIAKGKVRLYGVVNR